MADKNRIVLIGTSLDQESDAFVRTGLAWARAAGAKVHLAHAFSPPFSYVAELGPHPESDAFLGAEEARLPQAAEEQIRRLGIEGGELAKWSVRRGSPHRVLCGLAEELGAGLLVIGATAGSRLHRMLGSAADRIVRRACCPVLVVRGGLPVPPRRVLAPVDLSPLSAEALAIGLGRLGELRGDSGVAAPEVEALFVLSVLQRQVAPQFTPEQIDRFAAEELDRFVERKAPEAAGRIRRKVRTGNTREEILAEVGEWHPDLVLLGTHGLGGFDRLVIGSVTADVVREAPCSLLVVPPKAMVSEG